MYYFDFLRFRYKITFVRFRQCVTARNTIWRYLILYVCYWSDVFKLFLHFVTTVLHLSAHGHRDGHDK